MFGQTFGQAAFGESASIETGPASASGRSQTIVLAEISAFTEMDAVGYAMTRVVSRGLSAEATEGRVFGPALQSG